MTLTSLSLRRSSPKTWVSNGAIGLTRLWHSIAPSSNCLITGGGFGATARSFRLSRGLSNLTRPDNWTSSSLCVLRDYQQQLFRDYHCVLDDPRLSVHLPQSQMRQQRLMVRPHPFSSRNSLHWLSQLLRDLDLQMVMLPPRRAC